MKCCVHSSNLNFNGFILAGHKDNHESAWMSLNVRQIQQKIEELSALECLTDYSHFFLVAIYLILFKMQITRESIIFWMYSNFSQIGPQTTELVALQSLKITIYTYNGGNCVSTLLGCLLT